MPQEAQVCRRRRIRRPPPCTLKRAHEPVQGQDRVGRSGEARRRSLPQPHQGHQDRPQGAGPRGAGVAGAAAAEVVNGALLASPPRRYNGVRNRRTRPDERAKGRRSLPARTASATRRWPTPSSTASPTRCPWRRSWLNTVPRSPTACASWARVGTRMPSAPSALTAFGKNEGRSGFLA